MPLRFHSAGALVRGAVGIWKTQVLLRRLRHDMVVSVHDPLSGRMLWTRLEFDPRG